MPAALLLSATASADPIPAPAPAMPNIPFLSSLPGSAPQMLQGLASAFTGTGAPAAAPAASPAPAATASVTLPQPAAAPAAAPAASPLPGLLPAAAAPAAAPAAQPAGLVPTAEVQIPQVANSALPLPKELNFPGDLTSLLPPGLPLAGLLPKSPAAVPAATAVAPAAVAAVPAAVTPALPAAADSALVPLFFPTSALP
ncbi:hypothetical protein [Mycobacterium yunnanensis]|uniref:hypothetical protein n=1 Tax=Mycobacterium yunnanensis TaxID=368477 RepID=UPI0027E3527C|nr:hypothetical protein [Mycobacterium yunnanensis]